MTDELKQKLKDIFDKNIELTGNIYILMTDEAITEITQAFVADGWVRITQDMKDDVLNKYLHAWPKELMTGQEWYDKTMKEFLSVNRLYETENDDEYVAKFSDFVEAAQKAAGLPELGEQS